MTEKIAAERGNERGKDAKKAEQKDAVVCLLVAKTLWRRIVKH